MTAKEDILREAVASAPPVSVAGLALAGISLQDWVLIVTLIWILLQMGYFTYKRYKEWSDGRNGKETRSVAREGSERTD